jgi:hypothetical protein
LRDDAAASGPHGHAHGDLAPAANGALEQQIREIGAGDEQHESDRAQ